MTKNAARWRGTMEPREFKLSMGALAAYVVVLLIGQTVVEEGDPMWQRSLLAAALIALAGVTVLVWFRSSMRTREVDHVVVSEGGSLAFFATMVAAVTWGLLEAIVDAPRPSAWTVWTFGMLSWMGSTWLVRRKLF